MSISKRPRVRNALPVWHKIKLDPGKSWCGWCAGPAVGAETHFDNKRSMACRAFMSDGALSCDYCSVGWPSRWYAYCPLWDESGCRRLAQVGELFQRNALALVTGQCVKVTRSVAWGTPYKIESGNFLAGAPPLSEADREPFDFTDTALKMWGDGELSAWYRHHGKKSDNAVSLVTPTRVITPTPELVNRVKAAAVEARRKKDKPAPGQPGSLAEQFAKSKNGNGKGHK